MIKSLLFLLNKYKNDEEGFKDAYYSNLRPLDSKINRVDRNKKESY